MRRFLRLAAPLWRWMALSVLLGFATIGSSIGLMAASAWIITRAALQPSIAALQVAIVSVRAFGIARGVFRYLERLVSHEVTFRLLARLRVRFYRALEPLAPARLMHYRSGDLLARLVADIETLQEFYGRVLAPPVVAVLVGALMVALLWGYSPGAALAALAFYALAGAAVPLLTRWLSRAPARRMVGARAELNAALVDGVQGMADLVAFGRQDVHLAQVRTLSERLMAQQARMAWINGLQSALGGLLAWLAVLAALAAAVPVVQGIDLAVLALAVLASFEAVQPLPAAFSHLETSRAAAGRLLAVVEAPSTSPGARGLSDAHDCSEMSDLVVRDVRFAYAPDAPPALDGVSFEVPAGGGAAVVGPSGAGKSTLVNLLVRFWDYGTGSITLGGRELREMDGESVRRCMAVVPQRIHLFNATVRENLMLASPEAGEAAMIAAAQRAQIHRFVLSLPAGYATRVGELGVALSGGQAQRLALARAFLKEAPLLVLDEPTANLDAITARAVMREALALGRTTLVITHRLAGLEAMDDILVLRAGRIVERGQHAVLLAAEGIYARMWAQQNRELIAES